MPKRHKNYGPLEALHIRLTYKEGEEYPIKDLIEKDGAKVYIAAHEVGKRDGKHVHIYLEVPGVCSGLCKTYRSFLNTRGWSGKLLSVSMWGVWKEDHRYFYKGSGSAKLDISHTTHPYPYQLERNAEFWAVNKELVQLHQRKAAEKVSVTAALVEECRQRNATSTMEVLNVFIDMRMGKDQIDPFKHRGMLLSAWMELNKDTQEEMEMRSLLHRKIFEM